LIEANNGVRRSGSSAPLARGTTLPNENEDVAPLVEGTSGASERWREDAENAKRKPTGRATHETGRATLRRP
jgi:hypothetical protein